MSHPPPIENDSLKEALMGQALDEYSERLARGEQPAVEEYARRYPQLAAARYA